MAKNIEHVLPPLNNGSATVKVTYPQAPGNLAIISTGQKLTEEELAEAVSRPTDGAYRITRLLGDFKGQQAGVFITYFESQLQIEVKYSLAAWALACDSESGFPRVAYLAYENGEWAETWIEFRDGLNAEIEYDAPGGNPYGYVRILTENLPDPLIGGC
ncbi:MAG: hypothetical protein ACK2TT_04610 [Anaerolineales bacterium]|jgi:hypothetical protein